MPSISITKGRGSFNHNERKFSTPNVDKERTRLNVILKEQCIEQTYHELFDQALLQYNQKQKRADRKIDNYYKHILHSKKEKSFHELVVQVGNMEDDHQDFDSILEEYYRGFEKRNPQMKIVAAVIHNDEKTPHLHLDYVPFITGQKRGLSTKVANNRAMEQMGYKSFDDWRTSEMNALESILHEHGLNRTVMNNAERHRTVDGYKREQRVIESRIEALEHQKVKIPTPAIKKTITGQEMIKKSDYDELANNYKVAKEQIHNYQAQISVLREENKKHEQNLTQIKSKPYVALNRELQKEVDDSIKCINQVYDDIMNKYEPRANSIRERLELAKQKNKKTYEELEEENKQLKLEIKALKGRFSQLINEVRTFIHNIADSIYNRLWDIEETEEIVNQSIMYSFSNANEMQNVLDESMNCMKDRDLEK